MSEEAVAVAPSEHAEESTTISVPVDMETTAAASAASAASASATTVQEMTLPEGYSMMFGEDGQQYVTVAQGDQTYAFPVEEFQQMQESAKGGTIMLQAMPVQIGEEGGAAATAATENTEQHHEQVVVLPQELSQENHAAVGVVHVQNEQTSTAPAAVAVSSPPAKRIYSSSPTSALAATSISSPPDDRSFPPIRVDNWGIFLLNRLQSYFQKKEHCDLTVRFPSKNAQIKVHSLVVNACSDFFAGLEREGRLKDGVVDLPDEYTPEAVAPIIRFMYTGKLDIKAGMYSKLRATVEKLDMAVLLKLMDAHSKAPPPGSEANKTNAKRRRQKPLDPVKQIRKIKKIEKKFTADEKRARMAEQRDAARGVVRQHEFQAEGAMPGKKLPIWKKRSNQPEAAVIATPPPPAATARANGTDTTSQRSPNAVPAPALGKGISLKPVSRPPPGAKLVPISGPPPPRVKADPLPKAYGKVGSPEKPKIPRQIREMQQNLNFEKIRRTGAKNPNASGVFDEESGAGPSGGGKDMSLEEIKEMMDEQKKRLQEAGEDMDDDDYFDNDAGLDYDEAGPDEDIDDPGPVNVDRRSAIQAARPILKTDRHETPASNATAALEPTPRKSVRFSLTPTAAPSNPETAKPPEQAPADSTSSSSPSTPPKKRGRPTKAEMAAKAAAATKSQSADFDSTLDEFNRAVEEEEAGTSGAKETPAAPEVQRSRSGRIITRKSPDDGDETPPPKKRGRPASASPASSPSAKKLKKTGVVGSVSTSANIDLPSPGGSAASPAFLSGLPPEQAKLVQEVLKRNPGLLKEGKSIKFKVMKKTSDGQTIEETISIKIPPGTPTPTPPAAAAKPAKYTGRRGRPPKKADSTAANNSEGQSSAVSNNSNAITTLDQVAAADGAIAISPQAQRPATMDLSSEAEALSNVASGIATSLGLAAGAQAADSEATGSAAVAVVAETNPAATGPLADLEDFGSGQQQGSGAAAVVVNYEASGSRDATQLVVTDGETVNTRQVLQTAADGSVSVVPENTTSQEQEAEQSQQHLEAAMAKLHGSDSATTSNTSTNKGVTKAKLEMDWDDEDDEEASTTGAGGD